MNKKGFTLIELLAVIIVLAILVLMALPMVNNLMEKSRVNAFAVEANEISKVAHTAYNDKHINDEEADLVTCYTVDQLINEGYLDKDNGDVRGAVVLDVSGNSIKTYMYLSKKNYYVKKVSGTSNKVGNSDVTKKNGSSLYNDCTTTCTATAGGTSVTCGSTDITTLTTSSGGGGSSNTNTACEFNPGKTWTFTSDGSVASLAIPCNGYYKLEVWGAQGGSVNSSHPGGYGGYAAGYIQLTSTDHLYIAVGGKGSGGIANATHDGGYNGGGALSHTWGDSNERRATGGGATHIALNKNLGELKNYIVNQNAILIVAGGGGGSQVNFTNMSEKANGGHGGGTAGKSGDAAVNLMATGGTQNTGGTPDQYGVSGSFGQGGGSNNPSYDGLTSGGGGGFYGGGSALRAAGGGSGYLSSSLQNAHMACYECMASGDTNTIIIHSASETAASDVAKLDDGYAKIIYVGSVLPY